MLVITVATYYVEAHLDATLKQDVPNPHSTNPGEISIISTCQKFLKSILIYLNYCKLYHNNNHDKQDTGPTSSNRWDLS